MSAQGMAPAPHRYLYDLLQNHLHNFPFVDDPLASAAEVPNDAAVKLTLGAGWRLDVLVFTPFPSDSELEVEETVITSSDSPLEELSDIM